MPTAEIPAFLNGHMLLLWSAGFNHYFKLFWYFLPLALLAAEFNQAMKGCV